jgi:hypothetical protein
VSPVKYELGFYFPEDDFFIVTAVKTSNLTQITFHIAPQKVAANLYGSSGSGPTSFT